MEKAFMTNWLVLVSTEKRLSTRQVEDYTTGCFFLVCEYMKIHYGLIAVDLSGPKELEADPKAIQ